MKSSAIIFLLIIGSITLKQSYSQNIWTEENSGVSVQLNSIACFSNSRAWCCGNNGTVLKRLPVPSLWTNVGGNGIPSAIDLVNITSPSSGDTNIALTTGTINDTTYVYRTTNSGANWVKVFSQLNGRINAILFPSVFSNTNVFMQGNPVGGRWSLWKSTNGGLNWDSAGLYLPQSGVETGWNNSMYYSGGSTLSFGTNNSRIYYSTNSGTSWSVQSTSPEINIYTIFFQPGPTVSFSGGSALLKSTNYGVNWLPNPSIGSGNFGGLAGFYSSYWWYVRSDNKIYLSGNNGSSWVAQYTAPAGIYTHLFFWSNTYLIYAVRSNGGISRYLIVVGVNQISSEVPNEFSLSQNYPNPFNPTTNFEFQIAKSGFVNLTIYDVMGREIESLVKGDLKPGTYEADWNASNFPSGIYFYTLRTTGYTETKRMVLIK